MLPSFLARLILLCVDYDARNPWRFLKYAFVSHECETEEHREEIAEKRGVRWSSLNTHPDWLPNRDSPFDPMHGGSLGE